MRTIKNTGNHYPESNKKNEFLEGYITQSSFYKTFGSRIVICCIVLMLVLISAASCRSGIKVTTDYDRKADFSTYKTFSLFLLKSSGKINQLNVDRIWNSVREEMAGKGYKEDHTYPDLLVNAVSVVKEEKYLTTNSSSYGYGGIYRPYGFWGMPGSTTVQGHTYHAGTLVIDVVDTRTNKLIWQGTGKTEINRIPDNPDAAIAHAVKKILATFPSEMTALLKSKNAPSDSEQHSR